MNTWFHRSVKDFLEAVTPYDFVCCLDGIGAGLESGFLSSEEAEVLVQLARRLDKKLTNSYYINKTQEEVKNHD